MAGHAPWQHSQWIGRSGTRLGQTYMMMTLIAVCESRSVGQLVRIADGVLVRIATNVCSFILYEVMVGTYFRFFHDKWLCSAHLLPSRKVPNTCPPFCIESFSTKVFSSWLWLFYRSRNWWVRRGT